MAVVAEGRTGWVWRGVPRTPLPAHGITHVPLQQNQHKAFELLPLPSRQVQQDAAAVAGSPEGRAEGARH